MLRHVFWSIVPGQFFLRVLQSFVEDPENHYSSQIIIANYYVYRLNPNPI